MRKRYNRRGPRRVNKGALALKMVRKLNRSVEVKHLAEDYVNVPGTEPINPAGVQVGLTTVALGTDNYERVGNQLSPKYLDIRGLWGISGTQNAFCRVIIVQFNQAALSASLILQTTSSGAEVAAPYNTEWKPNFTVLYDKQFTIDANNIGQQFHRRIKLRKPISYNDGSSTPLKQGLSAYLFSSASSSTPFCHLAWDFAFTDM